MQKFASKITKSALFQPFIMGVILIASTLVGLETFPEIYQPNKGLFHRIDTVIQLIFTIEIILRILAHGARPLGFFRSRWNTFDFLVTMLFYLPFGGPYASVLRLIRIVRIFRLISALPRLQLMVGALIKSIPSIGYVGLLLLVQFYIFAVIGNFQFGLSDPEHFGNLTRSMITLFEIVTLEGWVDIYRIQAYSLESTIFFVTFIMLGTMIILNLFIGVVLNGFEEVKTEMESEKHVKKSSTSAELELITREVEDINIRLKRLAKSKFS